VVGEDAAVLEQDGDAAGVLMVVWERAEVWRQAAIGHHPVPPSEKHRQRTRHGRPSGRGRDVNTIPAPA
jgi:hypothetical protein